MLKKKTAGMGNEITRMNLGVNYLCLPFPALPTIRFG